MNTFEEHLCEVDHQLVEDCFWIAPVEEAAEAASLSALFALASASYSSSSSTLTLAEPPRPHNRSDEIDFYNNYITTQCGNII